MIVKRRSGLPCVGDVWVEGEGFTLRQRGAGRAFWLLYVRGGEGVLLSCELVVDGVSVDLGNIRSQALPPGETFESVASDVRRGLAVLWRRRRYRLDDCSSEAGSAWLGEIAAAWRSIGWDKSYEQAMAERSRRAEDLY